MKRLLVLLSVLVLVMSFAMNASAIPITADIAIIVDESGSMGGEHAWIPNMISSLDTGLIAAGLTGNQYALIGFGGTDAAGQAPHSHAVGGGNWGTAAQLGTAAGGLVISGGFEDGWNGIDYFINNYTTRAGAALNVILITDEDRDNQNGALSYAGVLSSLTSNGILLNAVVNHGFSAGGAGALGVDSLGTGFVADGGGGYTSVAGGVATSGFGTTKADYIDLAWATGGAAWDLNQLRAGGLTGDSFTAAFVDIKVEEITKPVPEPATLLLLGSGLVGLVLARRRMKK